MRSGERLENDNERNQKVKEAELSKKEVNVAMEKAGSISLSAFGGMSSKEGRFDQFISIRRNVIKSRDGCFEVGSYDSAIKNQKTR